MADPKLTPQLEHDYGDALGTLSTRVGQRRPSFAATLRRGVQRYWAPYVFISLFYILFAVFGIFPPCMVSI